MASETHAGSRTHELSIPLPRSIDTRIYVSLTVRSKAITLFLTTATADELATPAAMGSLVYAIPDRYNPTQPLATPLYSTESTLEFTTRIARLLARKTGMPTYVTNSMSFASAGMGGTVEEEMEAFMQLVAVLLEKIRDDVKSPAEITNGLQKLST